MSNKNTDLPRANNITNSNALLYQPEIHNVHRNHSRIAVRIHIDCLNKTHSTSLQFIRLNVSVVCNFRLIETRFFIIIVIIIIIIIKSN